MNIFLGPGWSRERESRGCISSSSSGGSRSSSSSSRTVGQE